MRTTSSSTSLSVARSEVHRKGHPRAGRIFERPGGQLSKENFVEKPIARGEGLGFHKWLRVGTLLGSLRQEKPF